MLEPVSVDDAIPVSLVMSGDGAEGAGSIVKVGPEGSGSFDVMGGDASAVTTIGPSPTTSQPRAADDGGPGHQLLGPHGETSVP